MPIRDWLSQRRGKILVNRTASQPASQNVPVQSSLNVTNPTVPIANATNVVTATPKSTTASTRVKNDALQSAIERYLDSLPEPEKLVFRDASQSMSDANLLDKVRGYDRDDKAQSQFRRHTDSVARFLGVLNRFMAGVAIGIQANPDISSIVVGAMRVVITLAIDFVGFFAKLVEMLDRFSDFLGPLAKYATSSGGDKLIQESLINVYVDLLTFCRHARSVFVDEKGARRKLKSWRVFWRLQWMPFEEEFGKIAADMQHHLQVLDHSAQAEGLNVSLEVLRSERQRKVREEVGERESFLTWLSSISFEETHGQIFAKKHPGTGDWLLQKAEFREWLDNRQSTLLWCHGKAGAGKSVLASNVIEYVTSKRALDETAGIAFAYYNYQSAELYEVPRVISALVKQLCRKKGSIPAGFLKIKQDALPQSQLGDQESFVTAAGQFEEVFLIVDALDECAKPVRYGILNFLREIVDDHRLLVKVFVTSRREMDIEDEFRRLNRPTIMVEARNVAADISKYVTDEVRCLREGQGGKRLYVDSDALALRIIDTLTAKADGMFLWVNLQLLNLCEVSESRKDREVERALQILPTGLDATYIRSLEQIEKQKDYMRSLAFKTLRWVLYAQRPLTTQELQYALAAEETLNTGEDEEPDDTDAILGACAHLLVKEKSGHSLIVRPIHYSVQEFLTTPSNNALQARLLNTFHDLNQIHAKLAETCISYLQSKLLGQQPCEESDELEQRVEDNPFLWYAVRSFDHHLICCTSLPKELIRSMAVFLEQSGRFFASVLQLKAMQGHPIFPHNPNVYIDFNPYTWTVDKRTLIFSTKLYDVHDLEDCWRGLEPPPAALHRACSAGLSSAVSRLLAGEINVNEKDDNGLTPIYYAAASGNAAIVRMLIERGADVNARGGGFDNALQVASFGGHESIVRLLLENNADVNAEGGGIGATTLQAASVGGHESIVRLLLENKADVNAQGGAIGTALQTASLGGHELIVRLLLENGANINAQGGDLGTALHGASYGGHESIVRLLLENGADVDARDKDYSTALQDASSEGHDLIVRLLLENRADIDARDKDHITALQDASSKGHESIVRLLLENKADVNTPGGEYDRTALQDASLEGHELIVRLLLENGADVDARDKDHSTALQDASSEGHESIVHLLLENGADVNVRDGYYGTALQAASRGGHESIVRLLLENGAIDEAYETGSDSDHLSSEEDQEGDDDDRQEEDDTD